MNEMYVANKIKDVRQYLAITQIELGKIVGATKQCVCSWEKGKSMPDLITFFKIVDISGQSYDEFFKDLKSDDTQSKFQLSSDEQKIIAKLRTMSLEKRKALGTFIGVGDKTN